MNNLLYSRPFLSIITICIKSKRKDYTIIIMIRTANKQDIPRIAEIIVFGKRTAYRTIFQNDIESFNHLQVVDLANHYMRNPKRLETMFVYDDGIIKGVINGLLFENRMELCDFYVEPFFKGQGIGRQLIQYLIQQAKRQNMNFIFLWVIAENTTARIF